MSKKFAKLLNNKKILLIKNKKLQLSFKKFSELLLKLAIAEINKNKIPIDNTEGNKNNPI